jgi:hypothetical protein
LPTNWSRIAISCSLWNGGPKSRVFKVVSKLRTRSFQLAC